jgi:hypothetical protein
MNQSIPWPSFRPVTHIAIILIGLHISLEAMIGVINHKCKLLELIEIKMEGDVIVDHMNAFPLADKYSLVRF